MNKLKDFIRSRKLLMVAKKELRKTKKQTKKLLKQCDKKFEKAFQTQEKLKF